MRNGRYLVLPGIAAIIVCATLYAATHPMLCRFATGPVAEDWIFVMFSPLRNRAPERTAEAYLDAMRTGQCSDIAGTVTQAREDVNTLCEKERRHPLTSWRLVYRQDKGRNVELAYIWYETGGHVPGNFLYVDVTPETQRWQVTRYFRVF